MKRPQTLLRCTLITGFYLLLAPLHSALAVDRQVNVSGNCVRKTTPDRGSITLTSEFQNMDLKAASQQATEAYEKVRKAVQKLGLENLELKTVEYSLNQAFEWQKDRQVFKGYRARMGISVSTSQTQRLGEVISIAAREGIRDVGGLRSFLSEEKLKTETAACLRDAALDARSKAEKLASALSAKVGEVISISENTQLQGAPPPPMPMMAKAMRSSEAMDSSAPVEAGEQVITVNVHASFGLK